ncbi:MAG TPA: hypothetical protein VJP77_05815 [Planctomycetota bacterium]|nr:hypothetical protein [Planctomycetota bacterium]
MSECNHDLLDRETAVTADGMCPLCAAAECSALRARLEEAAAEKLREAGVAHASEGVLLLEVETMRKQRDEASIACADLREERDAFRAERDHLREKNRALNDRATKAEGIIDRSGLVEGRPQGAHGRSIGRALANYAASKYLRERDESVALLYKTCGFISVARDNGSEIAVQILTEIEEFLGRLAAPKGGRTDA